MIIVYLFNFSSYFRFGFPRVIISDQGREFRTTTLEDVCRKAGIDASVYHPQCHGLTDLCNRTLVNQLLTLTQQLQEWDTKLDQSLFAYRTAMHASTKFTPYRLMFGRYVL
jgi:transposase InsO family protein